MYGALGITELNVWCTGYYRTECMVHWVLQNWMYGALGITELNVWCTGYYRTECMVHWVLQNWILLVILSHIPQQLRKFKQYATQLFILKWV